MFLRPAAVLTAVLAAALLLAGCTDADWDRTMSFAGLGEAPPPVKRTVPVRAAPAPRTLASAAPAAAAPDPFCQSVATHDAAANGFDPATQARVFAQSYAQCLGVFGPGR